MTEKGIGSGEVQVEDDGKNEAERDGMALERNGRVILFLEIKSIMDVS